LFISVSLDEAVQVMLEIDSEVHLVRRLLVLCCQRC